MSVSPASLLERLDQLKKWQHTQEQRLIKNHQQQIESIEKTGLSDDLSDNEYNNNTSPNSVNYSPINSMPTKQESSQNPLVHDVAASKIDIVSQPKVKRPFLRKGTGLQKFGIATLDQNKFVNRKLNYFKGSAHKLVKTERNKTTDNDCSIKGSSKENITAAQLGDITPLKIPATYFKPNKTAGAGSKNMNLQFLSNLAESTFRRTSNEHLADASKFRRTNSISPKESKFRKTEFSPPKTQTKFPHKEISPPPLSKFRQIEISPRDPINRITISEINEDDDLTDNDSTSSKNDQTITENCPSEQTLYENALANELQIFETLEQKVLQSSFCSTNSSVVQLLSTSTPHAAKKALLKDFNNSEKSDTNLSSRNKYLELINQLEQRNILNNNSVSDIGISRDKYLELINQLEQYNKDSSDTGESSDDSSDTYTTKSSIVPIVVVKQNAAVNTDESHNPTEEVSMVNTCNNDTNSGYIAKLEEDIGGVRLENRELRSRCQRYEHDEQRYQLERDRRESIAKQKKELEEFRESAEREISEQRQKLAKEKLVYEKHIKEQQNRPTRKEREETASLKLEIANLQEALKLKDSRNGTTQARLRNQVKSLEKENLSLRDELEVLRKKHAKLQQTYNVKTLKSQPISDTKMLHTINKNLTKLTKDALSKSSSLSKLSVASDKNVKKQRRSSESDRMNTSKKAERKNSSKEVGVELDSEEEDDSGSNDSFEELESSKRNSTSSGTSTKKKEDVDKLDSSGRKLQFVESSTRKLDSETRNDSNREFDNNSSRKSVYDYSNSNSPLTYDVDKNLNDDDIVRTYERTFSKENGLKCVKMDSPKNSLESKTERVLPDGSKQIIYGNGNEKTFSPDGNIILIKYYNGDIKETKLLDGLIRYFYANTNAWHSTYPDGREIIEFSNGQVEKKFTDGSSMMEFPNGVTRLAQPDGSERVTYPDGTVVLLTGKGEKTIEMANGQREIHSSEHIRREYPDGTVKILYADGLQETRYSNGRIRLKDKSGKLLMDSHES